MQTGDVVLHKESNTLITIVRLIGDDENPQFTQMDRRLEASGFSKGDPFCIWFHETELRQSPFRKRDLELYVAPAPEGADDLALDLDLDLDLGDLDLDLGDLDLDLGDDFNLDLDLGDDFNLDGLDLDLDSDTSFDFGDLDGDMDLDLGLEDTDFDLDSFDLDSLEEDIDLSSIDLGEPETYDFDFDADTDFDLEATANSFDFDADTTDNQDTDFATEEEVVPNFDAEDEGMDFDDSDADIDYNAITFDDADDADNAETSEEASPEEELVIEDDFNFDDMELDPSAFEEEMPDFENIDDSDAVTLEADPNDPFFADEAADDLALDFDFDWDA